VLTRTTSFLLCLLLTAAVGARLWAAPDTKRIGVLQERYADQMQEGKYEDALATLGALRALQPRSPRVAEWEGMTCFSLERWIDAIVAFRRALELGSSDPVVRQMLCEALCKEARKRLSDDDGEGAERLWEEALAAAPGYAPTHYHRALAYHEVLGDYQKAIEGYRRAVDLAPEWAGPLLARGRAYAALGQSELAVADYRAALRLAPDSAECQQELLGAFTASRDFAGAVECCAAQIQAAPTSAASATWYGRRADAHMEMGDYQRALGDYSAALSLGPDTSGARWLAGRALARYYLDDAKYAKEDLRLATERVAAPSVSPTERADGLAHVAWAMLELGWSQEALDVGERAAKAASTSLSLRSLAAALLDLRQGEQAALVAAQLYQLDAEDPFAHVLLGAALAVDRRSGDALPELRQGAALLQAQRGWNEGQGWLWYFLSVGHRALGDATSADRALQRALEAMPMLGVARGLKGKAPEQSGAEQQVVG